MKKYTQLMLVAALAAFASCNGNNGGDAAAQKAHDDSVINARSAEMEASMKRNNDSLINARAQEKADSMMNAAKTGAQKTGAVVAAPAVKATTKTQHTTTTQSNGTRVTDRPGATDAHVNDQKERPKPVTDRPGAIK